MRESGTVVWFSNTRGYGFLHRSEGRDLFVHFSGIDCDGYKTLKKDDVVEFEVITGDGGRSQAAHVKLQ